MEFNKKITNEVENRVLDVYLRVSPSHIVIDKQEDWQKFFNRRHNLLKSLSIPEQFLKDKKILDIGGGTGEKSLYYALNGANVTILDANHKSCDFAKILFSKFKKPLQTINKSLFDIDPSLITNFDIVVCEGVLHHTAYPTNGFALILNHLRNGSLVIIGVAESHGYFKRKLQRDLIHKLAGNDEAKIIEFSKKYFQDHINKAVKAGMRTEEAVIFDSWVNPQIEPISLEDICSIFYKNNVEYISAYPKLDSFYQTLPHSDEKPDCFNYPYYSSYYSFLEKIWMCDENTNFDFMDDLRNLELKISELKKLEQKIMTGSIEDNDIVPIQVGHMGVGIHYFVGMKKIPIKQF